MPIDPRSILQLDPRILQQIGNPTGGKLTQLGGMYNQGQQDIQKMRMLQQKRQESSQEFQMKRDDINSKLLLGFTDDLLADENITDKSTPEELEAAQLDLLQDLPTQHKEMLKTILKKPFGSRAAAKNANDLSDKMQRRLHKELYEAKDVESIFSKADVSKFTPESIAKAEESGNRSDLRLRLKGKEFKGEAVNVIYNKKLMNAIEGESGHYIDERTGEVLYGAVKAPTRQEQGGVGAFSKDAKLDKEIVTQVQMRDSINVLSKKYKEFKTSGYSKNKLSSWASSIGNAMENLGASLGDDWSSANASYDDLMVASGRVFDAYRKQVTGAQASIAELERHLSKRVPMEGDAETRFEAKLQAVIEFDEIASIRLSKLKQSGWIYAGTMGEGNDQTALVRNGDRVIPISQAMSLDMIPMFEDRRNQIMTEMAGGRKRADITPAERRKMAAKATERLRREGYNLDAR